MVVIAVDCGGTNLTVAHADRAGSPRGSTTIRTPPTADDITEAILDLMAQFPTADRVGVGIAGLVDHADGRLISMPHRPGSSRIADIIRARSGLPTLVDNDANTAGLAEATGGAGVGHRVVFTMTVGTGIGGGLTIDGKVERGRAHLGEVGHMSIDPEGPRCVCGAVGCWEEIASGRALDRAATAVGLPDGVALVAAARSGDHRAAGMVAEVGTAFGRGLANLAAIIDPDIFVVGGGVSAVGDLFLEPARRSLAISLFAGDSRMPPPLLKAGFGPAAGIVGAALMAGAPL